MVCRSSGLLPLIKLKPKQNCYNIVKISKHIYIINIFAIYNRSLINMKKLKLVLLLFIIISASYAQKPSFEWASQSGNTSFGELGSTIAADNQGSTFYAGEFIDNANFGADAFNSHGGSDVFLAKYNELGQIDWVTQMGSLDNDYVQDIVADNNGSLYLGGYFYGETIIGDQTFNSEGSQDVFIAKFTDEGDFIWAKHFGSLKTDYISAITVDNTGNLVITGQFYDDFQIGDSSFFSIGGADIYIAKFDPDGEMLWAIQEGGSSSDAITSISFDPDGNFVTAGSFYYGIQLGDTTLVSDFSTGVFIAKYNENAELTWARTFKGTYLSIEIYAACDHENNIYVSGNFSESITIGSYTYNAGPFNQDIYITKLNSQNEILWADHAASNASDQVIGITVDDNNNLYLTGHFLEDISFGTLDLDYTLCCGSPEIFVVNYTYDGNPGWGKQIAGILALVDDIVWMPSNYVFVSGLYNGDLVLDELQISSSDLYRNWYTCIEAALYTNVEEIADHTLFEIYPNPARDYITIGFELQESETIQLERHVVISDINGRAVMEIELPGSKKFAQINTANLENGIYFAILKTQDLISRTGSFIISR